MTLLLQNIHTIYINLDTRPDRKENILIELEKIGITSPLRFSAIKLDNGAIGCSMSHIKCLEMAIREDYEYVFICEDDIEVVNPDLFISNANKFLNNKNIDWDIVLVAGNNMLPYSPVTDYCIKIYNCLTTTGYIVKKSYYETLLKNFKEGVMKLLREPENKGYRIDTYWKVLQNKDNWYLIIPPSIVQKEDYSDIEKKVTNFKKYMLDYNKVIKKN